MDRPETHFGGKADGIVAGLDVIDNKKKKWFCLFICLFWQEQARGANMKRKRFAIEWRWGIGE